MGNIKINNPLVVKSMGGVVNVQAFGAMGNGLADDTNAINSALLNLSSAGGGVLYLPKGTYCVRGISQNLANVRVLGDGVGVTCVKFISGLGYDTSIVMGGANINNLTIADLDIDGNQRGGCTGSAIRLIGGQNVRLANLRIFDVAGHGISLADEGTVLLSKKDVLIDNVIIKDTNMCGVAVTNKSNANDNIRIRSVYVSNFGKAAPEPAAIDVYGAVSIFNVTVSGIAASGTVGIRFRPGETSDASGLGAHRSYMGNFTIIGDPSGSTMTSTGVLVQARDVGLANGYLAGHANGITINQQDCSVTNVNTDACVRGINVEPVASIGTADYALISAVNCVGSSPSLGTGIRITSNNCILSSCIMRNYNQGMQLTGSGIIESGNLFINTTTNIVS
jgi:hypothetical protein